MNVALKEWAGIVQALGSGRQVLLLRKGGIVEAVRHGFELRHRDFLLFPTFEHQNVRWLKPDLIVPEAREGVLPIRYLARVTDIWPAPPLETMRAAADSYIWNDGFLKIRYEYRPDLPLYVLVVRTYRLPTEQVIPDRPSYAGCKSWVNLTEDIDVSGASPVLGDTQYSQVRDALRIRLCASSL
jgi:hypothetical protein